jgi:hypothetical protein
MCPIQFQSYLVFLDLPNVKNGKILNELHIIAIKYFNQLFNAVLLKGYFPAQWKVTQIILILKPGKPPNELTSYLPISHCI